MSIINEMTVVAVLIPLLTSCVVGLGYSMSHRKAHSLTIAGLLLSFLVSVALLFNVAYYHETTNFIGYVWAASGQYQFDIGFLVDRLTALMMVTVTFVSLCVHIYSVGYMKGSPGYNRFFCYMSLFTFAMLMLVSANNFLQLFFGWEGVGFVSYLLIGFYFTKDTAAAGALKAFIVNRIGDVAFILALAALLDNFGTLDYAQIFKQVPLFTSHTVSILYFLHWHLLTMVAVLLFIGAMAKSAQFPLHVWLPESMEGPTPISALIHAATMVTAGVFLLARLSPLFSYAPSALSFVLIIGSTTALFLGLLAVVENDIKRIIAFSTMSQLGYMMAANGVSFYSGAVFHLMTHACFKALLFLAAGAVIVAVDHQQDIRQLGGLRKKLPVAYWTFLVGALALSAIPPFSGFYSKEPIIEAVHSATIYGSSYAYLCLLLGSFVTSFYIFRLFFLVFHGPESEASKNMNTKGLNQSPAMIRWPLIALAIPSVFLGLLCAPAMLFHAPSFLAGSVVGMQPHTYTGFLFMGRQTLHAILSWPCLLALLGIGVAALRYVFFPHYKLSCCFSWLQYILERRYGIDQLYQCIFVTGLRKVCKFYYSTIDVKWLDAGIVDGIGVGVQKAASGFRLLQTGYAYHYAFAFILAVLLFLVLIIF